MFNKELLIKMTLDALKFFDEFCNDNNLEYSLAFGSDLGAVRHKGFIPWDDDADVDMPIEDYIKLKKLWKKNLNDKYFLQTKENELFKPTLFYQLRVNGTTWIDPEGESVPMHWGIAIIDIFPVYHMPNGKISRKLQQKLYSLADRECMYSWNHRSKIKLIHVFHKSMALLYLSAVRLMSKFSKNNQYLFYPEGNKSGRIIKESTMYPPKRIQFENIQLNGHADQHNYLSLQYGDYMTPPPEELREGHPIGIIDLENDYTYYVSNAKTNTSKNTG